MENALGGSASNGIEFSGLPRQFRRSAKRMRKHPTVADDDVVAASGTPKARKNNRLICVEIDSKRRGDTGVIALLGEALVELHCSCSTWAAAFVTP